MSLINSISNTNRVSTEYMRDEVKDFTDKKRAEELEYTLSNICDEISYCNFLTKEKHIDVELLLQIVASYLIGRDQGELEEDVKPPRVLFEENLIPTLDELPDEPEVIQDIVNSTREEEGSSDNEGTIDGGEDTGSTPDMGS